MQGADTQAVLLSLGLPVSVGEMVWHALRHKSVVQTGSGKLCNNERLEFLGDSVIQLVISKYLYQRYPDISEGLMTKRRSRLVCGQTMTEIANKLGVAQYLLMGTQSEEKRTFANTLEDAFEALAAAVFLSSGYEAAESWVIHTYEKYIDIACVLADDIEYKDKLLRHFTSTGRQVPEFRVTKSKNGQFTASIHGSSSAVYGVGAGGTRKQAENEASKQALVYLE